MIDLWKDHYNVMAVRAMLGLAECYREQGRSPAPFYRAAGQHLTRLAHGRPQSDWADLVKTQCELSLSRAKELIQIAHGKSLTEVRSRTAARTRKARKNKGRNQ